MIYARKGEMVICENGHSVGQMTRDLYLGEVLNGDEIEGIFVELGEVFPKCPVCGGWFTWQKDNSKLAGFMFSEGIREFGPPDQLRLEGVGMLKDK